MPNNNEFPVVDLRTAIQYLENYPDEIVATDVEVDPHAELSGVYRHVGAFGTVQRPTRLGPAMLFNKVKGYDDVRVLIGLLASRGRVARLLNTTKEQLPFVLKDSVMNPLPPKEIASEQAPVHEVVHYATDPDFDILKILPAPTNTEEDAGPYFTMGMCYAADPETGEYDVTIHRLCVQSKDEISVFLQAGRHIGAFYEKAEKLGKPLPFSISIGVDPAIEIGACFEPPTTPIGYDELQVAGALRGKPVDIVKCKTIDNFAIARAEVVIEGELLPNRRVEEDQNTGVGKAMPEFPGYTGAANPSLPIIKVKAITHRRHPILQTCIGPSEEHTNMAGIPTEASILQMTERALPGLVKNVYAASPGTGKYVAILQINKTRPADEGRQRQAALIAFTAFPELKHCFLVDADVDIYDMNDVMWAMTTRFQSDVDVVSIPGVRCHPLDPSSDPAYATSIRDHGIATKTIFDCTVPYHLREHFQRSHFKDVDVKRFLPDFDSDA
ncbi:UbiD family decarboxylase [Celerinatantimonas sp. MCCC 1A17872]|uniref:UbiD family decarboxylase n=1 Tax=Celerinatantimonas sp. MCCC 1A17872 TaxID=3177514 RepID=UPI0038CB4955